MLYKSDDILKLGVTNDEFKEYADLLLGYKIRDCIIQNGFCSFEAEL